MGYYSDKQYKKKTDLWFEKLYFDRWFKGNLGPILDLGCATGNFIATHPDLIEGVENDPDCLRSCQERGLKVKNLNAGRDLDVLPDNYYNGVYAKQLIEHLVEPLEFLKQVRRLLKPGGTAVIITPNCPYALNRFFWDDYTHVRPLTRASLERLAFDAGFTKFEISEDFRCFRGLGWLIKKIGIRIETIRRLQALLGIRGLSLILKLEKEVMPISCPICHKANNISLQDKKMNVYTCHDCQHDFTVLPPGLFEHYGNDYYDKDHRRWFENPNFPLFKRLINEIQIEHPGQNIAVLDIGCGKGDFLKFYCQRDPSAKLFGVDISDNKNEPGISFFKGDFFDFEPAEKFDAIINIMVIEHLADPISFVNKASRLLKSGGTIYTITINNGGVIFRLSHWLKNLGIRSAYDRLHHYHHLQHYTNKSLKKLMANSDLEIVRLTNHNFPLAALDVPQSNRFIEIIYRSTVGLIFMLTNLSGGMNQTIVCRKNNF